MWFYWVAMQPAISIVLGAISIGIITVEIILWVRSARRRLAALEENLNDAMRQIGVQLSARFDFLMALFERTKECSGQEGITLIEAVKSGRSEITAKSAPGDVERQEGLISEALGRLALICKQHPELKTDEDCIKCLDAVETFRKMVRTSRLVYNNCAAKLNREMQRFPVSVIAGRLGFFERGYLNEGEQ